MAFRTGRQTMQLLSWLLTCVCTCCLACAEVIEVAACDDVKMCKEMQRCSRCAADEGFRT